MTLNDVVVPIEILTYSAEEGTVNGHTVTRGRYPTIHDACIALTVPYAQQAGAPILTHAVDTIGTPSEYWLHVHPDGQATPASAGSHPSPVPRQWDPAPAADAPPAPARPEPGPAATPAFATDLAPLPVLAPLPTMAPFPAMPPLPVMPDDLAHPFEPESAGDDDPHGLAVTQTFERVPAHEAPARAAWSPETGSPEPGAPEPAAPEGEASEAEAPEADARGAEAREDVDLGDRREVVGPEAEPESTQVVPVAGIPAPAPAPVQVPPAETPAPASTGSTPPTRSARRHAAETDEPGETVQPEETVQRAETAVTAVTAGAVSTHAAATPPPVIPPLPPFPSLLTTARPAAPPAPAPVAGSAMPSAPAPSPPPASLPAPLATPAGPAWVAFAQPGAPSPSPSPTLDDLLATRPAPPDGPAQLGWRATVRRLTGGLITLRPSGYEASQRRAIAAVQRSLTGPKTVVVINPKGGASKTTATLLLAATFGIHRGGYTLAWDNNETRGTMGWRAMQGRHTNTAVDLLRELDRFENARSARVGDLDNFVRSQGNAQFDVLASDEDAASAASVDATAFNALHSSLSRFYRVIVVDTGNNMRASNWDAAIAAADQVVIVSTIREDTGQSAAWVADALNEKGHADKVSAAVTILAAPSSRPDPALATRLQDHFGRLTRGVVTVPFDASLVSGGPIDIAALSSSSRDAWLEATALVADGL